MSRSFPDCVELREMFWGADPIRMNKAERQAHLRRVLISSFDRTVRALLEEGGLISIETMQARNELIEAEHRAEDQNED